MKTLQKKGIETSQWKNEEKWMRRKVTKFVRNHLPAAAARRKGHQNCMQLLRNSG
jgi:hypothetical protein